MNLERAQEHQERIAKEGLAMLTLFGTGIDTVQWEQAVELISKAWNIPQDDTRRWLDDLSQERKYAEEGTSQHVYPEEELPMNATGTETLNNVWDLFETATQLDDQTERQAIFDLAMALADQQNLLDWIEKSPAEKAELRELVS